MDAVCKTKTIMARYCEVSENIFFVFAFFVCNLGEPTLCHSVWGCQHRRVVTLLVAQPAQCAPMLLQCLHKARLWLQLTLKQGRWIKSKVYLIVEAGKGQQQVSSQNRQPSTKEHERAGRVSKKADGGQKNRADRKRTKKAGTQWLAQQTVW